MNNISVKELLLGEFDAEMATTRKILERVRWRIGRSS
jgi:hypothetical protein